MLLKINRDFVFFYIASLEYVPFLSNNMSTFLNLSGKKACQVRKLHLDNKY